MCGVLISKFAASRVCIFSLLALNWQHPFVCALCSVRLSFVQVAVACSCLGKFELHVLGRYLARASCLGTLVSVTGVRRVMGKIVAVDPCLSLFSCRRTRVSFYFPAGGPVSRIIFLHTDPSSAKSSMAFSSNCSSWVATPGTFDKFFHEHSLQSG